ncbi:xylulokinase [Variovorax sp. J22R133]|uniref:xylulokinase n=1 Tax=Variovorax brevis TaxID=3053503 RepID=UPI002578BCC6|nr:xylulokinase [Variovorax sp. J22R133]MDM0115214.1 xylulokinase [Variovorax sp. J22R133]
MDLGIDLGTSEVKVVLVDDAQSVVGQAHCAIDISRPHPLWSEQDPQDWWRATETALGKLRAAHPKEYGAVRGIGLSGQMHGATLLDAQHRVLRPAILWNDGRSHAECAELEQREPDSRRITGNIAMPGFTAPKLMWVEKHEPDIFRQTALVLLPKDHVRLQLTGEAVSDMSDSAGTLWLDVAARRWSDAMLAATHLNASHMPRLVEGSESSGTVRADVAARLGLSPGVIVAGGAGDNAASAAGIGVASPGTAFLSLGTSGVYFVANEAFSPNPSRAVHAFCHAFPGTWHQMTVMLAAASCLRWLRTATHADSEAQLVAEAEALPPNASLPIFLPYLSGERTPHNNPYASGTFFGLTHDHGRGHLARSVLEGVAFAFLDGQQALIDGGARIDSVTLVGGGSRSAPWAQLLADVLGRALDRRSGAEVGAALGAARLARLARTNESVASVCTPPPVTDSFHPDASRSSAFAERHARFQRLYEALRAEMQPPTNP